MCSGASGVEIAPETEDELRFGEALDALLRQLALDIVRDGEGAARVGRVVVTGGDGDARRARRPRRRELAAREGRAERRRPELGPDRAGRRRRAAPTPPRSPLDIAIEGVPVCARGAAARFDEAALAELVARDEVEYVVGLPGEGHETEVFFSDLSHGYVTINADYTT